MAQTIILKNSQKTTPPNLTTGEVAITTLNNQERLWIKNSNDQIINIAITKEERDKIDIVYNNNHNHNNKTILDGITTDLINNWNTAYTNNHTHSNKSVIDGITTDLINNWNTAYTNNHIHNNKIILDTISQADRDVLNHLFIVDNKLKIDLDTYSTGELSAYGAGSGGSGGSGGGLIATVYGSTDLGGTFNDANYDNTFNAYSINEIYKTGYSNTNRILNLESGTYNKNETDARIAAVVNSAPSTLDTLNELSNALGNDPNFATTTANLIGTKLSLSGGQLTGQLSLLQGAGGGIVFPNDSFGGGGDSASIKLLNPAGGESTEMTFTMTNDADDIINFSVPSIDGVKINRYTVWNAGNFTNLNQLTTRNFSDLQNKPTTIDGYQITDGVKNNGGLWNISIKGRDNTAANALLQSGSGRSDDESGSTWLFLDSAGGVINPWGIKHNQAGNYIEYYGNGLLKTRIDLNNGYIYTNGKANTGDQDLSNLSTYSYVDNNFLNLTGGTLSGQLILNGLVGNKFDDGIRINNSSVNWSSIMLGGVAGSTYGHNGTSNWFIAANPGSVFMINPINSGIGYGLDLYRNGEAKWRGNTIWHAGNDGAGSGLDADLVRGLLVNTDNSPFGRIPSIGSDGVMEVGGYIDTHYDNTGSFDYSTRLRCQGNYENSVNLPTASGTLALLSDNVESANRLKTTRTIWGQNFDGTGSVSGNLTNANDITFSGYLYSNRSGAARTIIDYYSGGIPIFGCGTASAGIDTYLDGNNIYLRTSSSHANNMMLTSSGNVLIGTTTDSGHKLNVAGNVFFGGTLGTTSTLTVRGTTAFDSLARLNITNGSADYGRAQLRITGRLQNGNDGWSMDNGRNTIIFGVNANNSNVGIGEDGVSKMAIQYQMVTNQLGIVSESSPDSPIASISQNGAATFNSLGIANTSPSSGKGLSLFNGATDGKPTDGLFFGGTSTFGTHGAVTDSWAMYFTMYDATNRGWIFQRGSTNVASINGGGNAEFNGAVTGSRFYTGFDSGIANSISCSGWFRSNSATGWYNETYGGGIYMTDYNYVRVYNKAFKVSSTASDSINTDGGVLANGEIRSNSNITAQGELTAYVASDSKLKKNIKPIDNALDVINKLEAVSYNWNNKAKKLNENKTDQKDFGLIAQDVEAILPEIVHNIHNEKYKAIDYIKLIPFLIKSVQEQQKQIEELKKQLQNN